MPERAVTAEGLAPGYVHERDVLRSLAPLLEATYQLRGARPPRSLNCSWVGLYALRAWGLPIAMQEVMLWDPVTTPWGPVSWAIDAGIAVEVTEPEPWTICQGWTGPAPGEGSGHTFVVLDVAGDRWLSLEGHERYGLDGMGHRGVGNSRDVSNPGPRWAERGVLPLWSALPWPRLRMARLRVAHRGEWLQSGDGWPTPDPPR